MNHSHHPKVEISAFEFAGLKDTVCLVCKDPGFPLFVMRPQIVKHLSTKFVFKSKGCVYLFTDQKIEKTSIFITDKEKYTELEFVKTKQSLKEYIRLFILEALENTADVLIVKNNLFCLPFESFHMMTRDDKKSKIFPMFRFEIIETAEKVFIVFEISLYSENYADLSIAMRCGEQVLLEDDRTLVTPLVNMESNFFYYKGHSMDMQTQKDIGVFKSLKTGKTVTGALEDFNLLTFIPYSSFTREKLYFLLKVKSLFNSMKEVRACKFELSLTPDSKVLYESKINMFRTVRMERKVNFQSFDNWVFMCDKQDIQTASKLVKDLLASFCSSFNQPQIKPPKAYTVDTTGFEDKEQAYLNALKNKLNETNTVVVVLTKIGDQKQNFFELNEYLINMKKKFIILNSNKLFSTPNYFQKKVFQFTCNFYESLVCAVKSFIHVDGVGFISVIEEDNRYLLNEFILLIHNDYIEKKENSKPFDRIDQLESYLSETVEKNKAIHFFFTSHIALAINPPKQPNLFIVKKSFFDVYLNFAITQNPQRTPLNFQNYKDIIRYDEFFKNPVLEQYYNTSFLTNRLCDNSFIFTNFQASYLITSHLDLNKNQQEQLQIILSLIQFIYGCFDFHFSKKE